MENKQLLWKKNASEVVSLLDSDDISIEEAIESCLERIEEVDPTINAIPIICKEKAYDDARNFKYKNTILKGLPIFIKDITDVAGVNTTYGSEIYKYNIPSQSDYLVENLEKNGAIVLGKTNIPEFAAGSHTFNQLFGTTKNPWNIKLSSGGSSGGSAAALASGMAWLATGSDLGGSLRNPASWCGVTGLRPTAGLVAHGPSNLPYDTLSVDGPMARNTEDLALFLDAMSGLDTRDPLSRKKPIVSYWKNIKTKKPLCNKIAYTEDFNFLPCDIEIRDMMKNVVKLIKNIGWTITRASPDLSNSEYIFQTLRSSLFFSKYNSLIESHSDNIKKDILWNINKGKKLNVSDINKAEKLKGEIYRSTIKFFNNYDFLIAPSSMVPAFTTDIAWIREVEGKKFDNYVSWLMTAACVSLTGCPSLSISSGFSKNKTPIGIQIIGAPFSEDKLLSFANSLEKKFKISEKIPININNK